MSTVAWIYEYHQKTTVESVSESEVQGPLVSNRCVASATANCMAVQPIYDHVIVGWLAKITIKWYT